MGNDMQPGMQKVLTMVMAITLLGAMILLSKKAAEYIPSSGTLIWTMSEGEREPSASKKKTIVLDAGHGGVDPGKIAINQLQEKDINLQIAQKVKKYLEQAGYHVIMTRDDDRGLYQESDQNKKISDMRNRVAKIDQANANLAVSIHQNSYQDERVHGAQVFYYKNSAEGKNMAQVMQDTLTEVLNPEKRRDTKANDTYFLLKKTSTPTIIVECGFLSNQKEAGRLGEDSYQERVAWAITMGIMRLSQ